MRNTNAFYETRKLFIDYTQYTRPLSYEEWVSIPGEYKAAVLYVQFFQQITLAWEKTKSFFVVDDDGVSTVLQYLVKNVPIIENDPKRFTPNYIYRVAYNCLYCISHDIKRDIDRYNNETSSIISCDDSPTGELNLFDTVAATDTDALSIAEREYFWSIIEDMGLEAEKVVYHILNGESLSKVNKRSKAYATDHLRDIEVSLEEMDKIIEELKVKLASFRKIYNI